jgi:EmrB/QacA subfamily drug resistance transporter
VVASDLQTDVATIEWVLTLHLLVLSGTLLTFGRLGDLRGHRRLYLYGLGVMTLGALLCGLANSALALIAFRCVQAIGGAMMSATSLAILIRAFPASQRGQAVGLSVMLVYLGLTVAPLAGGGITAEWGWRAIFLVNVPLGVLALLLGLRCVPDDSGVHQAGRFDVLGAAIFTLATVLVLLGMNQGQSWGWGSPLTVGVLAAGVALLAVFVGVEARVSSPMLDLELFRSRTFSAANAGAVLNYMAAFGMTFVLPFYLIEGRGMSAAQAGLLLTSQPLVMAVVAPIAGTLSDRIGARALMVAGMLAQALGLVLLARLGPEASFGDVVVGLALNGLGMGLFSSPNNSAAMGAAPPRRQGIASGVVSTARFFGMAIGVGLAGAIYTTVLTSQAGSDPAAPIAQATGVSLLAMAGFALLGAVASAAAEPLRPHGPAEAPARSPAARPG